MSVTVELTPTPAISGMEFPMFSLLQSIAKKIKIRSRGAKYNIAEPPVGHADLLSMRSTESIEGSGFQLWWRKLQDVIGKTYKRGKISLSPLLKAEQRSSLHSQLCRGQKNKCSRTNQSFINHYIHQ